MEKIVSISRERCHGKKPEKEPPPSHRGNLRTIARQQKGKNLSVVRGEKADRKEAMFQEKMDGKEYF